MQGSSPDADVDRDEAVVAEPDAPVDRRRPEPATVEPATRSPSPVTAEPIEVPDDVGLTVLSEAQDLVATRRFSDAARVLESLRRLRPDDPDVLALSAIAEANRGRNRRQVRSWLSRLSTEFGDRPIAWRTVGEVAMARFQFDPAQSAVRTAVQLDPNDATAWQALAATYAGHGWFDEAQSCLDQARRLDPVGERSDGPIGFGQWQIGRAVNYWALTRTYVIALSVIGLVVFGLLGLALALSSPMLIREVRVRQAPQPFRALADLAWRHEHRLRLLNALAVAAVLLLWLGLFTLAQ